MSQPVRISGAGSRYGAKGGAKDPQSPTSVVEIARDWAESLAGFWRSGKNSSSDSSVRSWEGVSRENAMGWAQPSSRNLSVAAAKRADSGELLLNILADELILQVLGHMDVRQVFTTMGGSCQRLRRLCGEWLPWRCVQLRKWVTVPNYHKRIAEVYTSALSALDPGRCSPQDATDRVLEVAELFASAGLYRECEALLERAAAEEKNAARLADLLHALADSMSKAMQARCGGGGDYLERLLAAALRTVTLRRKLCTDANTQGDGIRCSAVQKRRKLALTLEILAENAACYGHSMRLAAAQEGLGWSTAGAESRNAAAELSELMCGRDPFELAADAARECVELWAGMMASHGSSPGAAELAEEQRGKLADAWTAGAAVDFYARGRDERALAKLRIARRMCRVDAAARSGQEHPRHALVLFNIGYISRIAANEARGAGGAHFGGASFRAAGLFSLSLRMREQLLGRGHPFTAATRRELAKCLGDLGAHEEASALLARG